MLAPRRGWDAASAPPQPRSPCCPQWDAAGSGHSAQPVAAVGVGMGSPASNGGVKPKSHCLVSLAKIILNFPGGCQGNSQNQLWMSCTPDGAQGPADPAGGCTETKVAVPALGQCPQHLKKCLLLCPGAGGFPKTSLWICAAAAAVRENTLSRAHGGAGHQSHHGRREGLTCVW